MHEDGWYNIMNNNTGGYNVFSTKRIIIIKNAVPTQHDSRYRHIVLIIIRTTIIIKNAVWAQHDSRYSYNDMVIRTTIIIMKNATPAPNIGIIIRCRRGQLLGRQQ